MSTGNKVQAGLSFDDGIKKALSLWSVAQKMEVEEEAVECLKALVQRQVKNEAGSRLEKIRAGVRLAESIRPGGGIDTATGMIRVSKESRSTAEESARPTSCTRASFFFSAVSCASSSSRGISCISIKSFAAIELRRVMEGRVNLDDRQQPTMC